MKLILKIFRDHLSPEKSNKGWQKQCRVFLHNCELFATKLHIL